MEVDLTEKNKTKQKTSEKKRTPFKLQIIVVF